MININKKKRMFLIVIFCIAFLSLVSGVVEGASCGCVLEDGCSGNQCCYNNRLDNKIDKGKHSIKINRALEEGIKIIFENDE